MLSRVANSTYWMARYVERAENIARFIGVNLHMLMDLPVEHSNQWESLISASGDDELFKQRYGSVTQQNVIEFLTFDESYPNSIYSCVRNARENARTIREQISSELWRHINEMYLDLGANIAPRRAYADMNAFCESTKSNCTLFKGLCDSTMTHGEAWQFMRLGRMTERADKTSRILDVKYFTLLPDAQYVGTPYDNIQWASLLKSVSALEMFRLEYLRIEPRSVIEFLILDPHFPRSIRFCVTTAEGCLHKIAGTDEGDYTNPAERQLGRLASELAYTDVDEIRANGVHQFIDNFQLRLNLAGAGIAETFFGVQGNT